MSTGLWQNPGTTDLEDDMAESSSISPEGGDISPQLRADSAVRAILLRQLAAIEDHLAGTLARLDSEYLHNLRVAVRRTRSALGQLKEVFPARPTRRYANGFFWLGQITGEARDLEVHLLGFDAWANLVPPSMRGDLEPLRAELSAGLDRAYADLARRLGSRRFRDLIEGWGRFLGRPEAKHPRAANARLPAKTLADRRIHKLFRRVLKQGRAIKSDTPAEYLHELRKTCKKLRYLLEFFQAFYPADDIKPAIRQLKLFQEHLGDFQDVHAQLAWLRETAARLRKRPGVSAGTLLAMGALLGGLEQRQETLRREFGEHFKRFDRKENRVHYGRLFAAGRQAEK
ncbi:CHAD domain-containing protein [Methylococcus sp. EFPC2]|uniref:CHAD domain-containing protein n=1 Tax=Methylococcus sp. EFPC2 TaxID=2812648 RepID=UPI001967F8B6|nr:CHAD domain-containing protein [Methylococcus sp. EFPC2]QSA97685.1 CHAD domain-containing protein [Methylococcus sp. EFPC2]